MFLFLSVSETGAVDDRVQLHVLLVEARVFLKQSQRFVEVRAVVELAPRDVGGERLEQVHSALLQL